MTRRRVAVVGGGAAGCGAAWSLAEHHDVVLFEASHQLGGHADAVEVDAGVTVDLGVMGVRKGHTSANLGALMRLLGVETVEEAVTLGADLGPGKTWTNHDDSASRRARFDGEITRLEQLLAAVAERPLEESAGMSVRDFLRAGRFSPEFADRMIDPALRMVLFNPEPLGAALAALLLVYDEGFISFRERPVYRRVVGGTRSLYDALARRLGPRVRTNAEAVSVERGGGGVRVRLRDGTADAFDDVVLAVDVGVALRLLADASDAERTVLEGLRPEPVDVLLHDDDGVWGRHHEGAAPVLQVVERGPGGRAAHFDVRAWHRLPLGRAAIMSRGAVDVAPERVDARRRWWVGPLTPHAFYCRSLLPSIQGVRRTWFCGQGFTVPSHDECFVSGLVVAERLGAPMPFQDSREAVVMQGFVRKLLGERGRR